MIEIQDLVKSYGGNVAVDHLSATIEKGKIYGFLGPNGAGKSTTMNIMTGYVASTSGTVRIDGHDILEEPEEAKRHMGYLPEIPPLYMDMSPYEQLMFAAELKGLPRGERRGQVEEVMGRTQIEDMADRLNKHLSRGYRQRVGLAQALLGHPDILILDEPTAGLDPLQITEIRELIRQLGKDHTVILSSHILSEVSALCDDVLIISHGKLVAQDSPQHLGSLAGGGQELKVAVKASRSRAEALLRSIPEVKEVRLCTEGWKEEGCCQLLVRGREGSDIREAVFYKMADTRTPLMGMERVSRSLEAVFLELTEEETAEKTEKKTAEETAEKRKGEDGHAGSV